jgi:hypothetical protein
MKLLKSDDFDIYQAALTREIVEAIKRELEQVDAPNELVKELTGNIAFAVTSLIDDLAGLEIDGKSHSPVLTFLNESDVLEFANGNSWMHEHVFSQVEQVFAIPAGAVTNDKLND